MLHGTNGSGPPATLGPRAAPRAGERGNDRASNGGSSAGGAGSGRDWRRLRDAGLATLAWLVVIGMIFWALAHVIGTLLIFLLAAILAYALAPAVKHLERFMPRGAAIALVYVGILTTLSGLLYLIAITAVGQVSMLLGDLQSMLSPASSGHISPLVATFRAVGLSDAQIQSAANRMLAQIQNLTGDAVSVAAGVVDAVVRTVLVGVLSIYLVKDGPLVVQWLRNNTPISHRPHVVFAVETLDNVVGGYIRGQLTLSALIGLLVGVGMWAFHVPYAVFLGVLAFVLEFVPLVGVFVSGAICVILALSVGWLTAVFVLAYFVIVHFIEGDFVGPRIMSRAVGLHPAVSILALVAGAELFGVWGALFAAPVAGLVQAVLRALWLDWRTAHPEQFPTGYTVTPAVRLVPVTHVEAAPVGTVEPPLIWQPAPLAAIGTADPRAADPPDPPADGRALVDGRCVVGEAGPARSPTEDGGAAEPAKALLPEVAAWEPRHVTISFYEQFRASMGEVRDAQDSAQRYANAPGRRRTALRSLRHRPGHPRCLRARLND